MSKQLKSPFAIVAEVLNIKIEELNNDSCMGITHNWDSLNHVGIITALEEAYGITINDNELMKYNNMAAITNLFESLSSQ